MGMVWGFQRRKILPPKFIYKKLCIYSYMFKLQSPSKFAPFDAIHVLRCIFHCSRQFLNSSISVPFSASAIFSFTFSTSAKCFPWRTFFHPGKQAEGKEKSRGVNREGRAWESCRFWSETLSTVWAGALVNYPS